jgi:hypothetical protein
VTDWPEKSFDFAADLTKQLITLATVVVTITVTFSKDVLSVAVGSGRGTLVTMWVAFLASILFGLLALMAMTGQIGRTPKPDIYAGPVRLFSILQIVGFLLGVSAAIWFVVHALDQNVVVPVVPSPSVT